MKRGLKITFLPFVFLAVRVESRFSRNVVLVESSADIVLVFGGKVRFFPVEAVVFSAAEMGYQLAFQRLEILVGNFIEQVADSPTQHVSFVSIGNRRIDCYPLECTVD